MQFKLLNFHKMLANFAVSLISVFIPLIILQQTGNMLFSILYLLVFYSFRILFVTVLKKHMMKRPQLFLLLRVVPMVIFASSVLLIDVNLWLGVVLVCVFGGMSDGFAAFSNEIILNYSSLNKGGKSFGLTRLFEQLGIITSVLAGGFILDNFGKVVVIIISISVYLVSVIPLLYYYIKFRKNKDFNKEAISNAFLTYDQKQTHSRKIKKVSSRVINNYFLLYLLMCFMDTIVNSYNLFAFAIYGTFTFASLVSAAFNGMFGVSSYVVGRLNEKYDTSTMVLIASLVMAVVVVALPFVPNQVVVVMMFAVLGGLYPFSSVFLIEIMLIKTRILGISNNAIFARENASSTAKMMAYSSALFGTLLPVFFVIGIAFGTFAIIMPKREEVTRKILVDYLEGN